MQNTKQQKAKDSAGGIVGYLVSIIISAVVIIYLGYHFLSSFGAEMTTEYALMITENDMVEFDAYILRNETVVYSTVTGGGTFDSKTNYNPTPYPEVVYWDLRYENAA